MKRNISVDYLRSFVTILVVFHHSALAYTSFSYFNASNYVASIAPVVDSVRWSFLDVFVGLNDTFFMSLMFLISGLFILPSIKSSGNRSFVLSRVLRIGVPFIMLALIVIPLAYWPSWRLSEQKAVHSFLFDFYTLNGWPSGPAWFLWALMAFSLVILLLNKSLPNLFNWCAKTLTLTTIFLLTIVAYVPVSLILGPNEWGSLGGPFDIQLTRVGLYFMYFLLGSCIGTSWDRLSIHFSKYWLVCILLGLLSFSVNTWLILNKTLISSLFQYQILSSLTFSISCAGMGFGLLGCFLKFGENQFKCLNIFNSTAYGIFLVHYVFVTWLQFFLLEFNLPAWSKFTFVFLSAVGLSLIVASLLTKLPYVRRIV